MGEGSTVGFSPCIRHLPASGNGDMKRLAGAKALIIQCFRGGPTEVVPLLQNRPWIAIGEIKMRLPWLADGRTAPDWRLPVSLLVNLSARAGMGTAARA
jgi:hypothetical protein